MKNIGTVALGVRAPIIREGDDLVQIVVKSVLSTIEENALVLEDKDIVSVTEAVLARSQGNYANLDDIAADTKKKFSSDEVVGLIFPILSRNRFALLLKGIARGVKKLVVQLSYPSDEVGNHLVSLDDLDKKNIDPSKQSFTEKEFIKLFPNTYHEFTGIDYISYYKELASNIEIVLSNNPLHILSYTKSVINADIHTRARTKRILLKNGAKKVYSLDEFLQEPVNGSGYNSDFGLLGSNLAKEDTIKLFPRGGNEFVLALQRAFYEKTKKEIECMIYGDGAFKDPIGGIWELADPVVSPGFTKGLIGQPNELKLKYIADNDTAGLTTQQAESVIKQRIKDKADKQGNSSLGTTPRRLVDLVGSLSDLVSGSGDKGTPIVLIKNYFKNYSS